MLEAKIGEASILKKLLDATRELVTDANFECTEEGIGLQAMDNSHVALVIINLDHKLFLSYRCDRPMPLGVNLNSLAKVLKCAKDDDVCTLKASDDADLLNLVYEAKNADRIAEYEMKLMDIDADTLGIPDTAYEAKVTMPVAEFARIVRDLSQLGESVRIEVSKEGARFTSEGEAANGNVLLKHSSGKIGKVTTQEPEEEEEDDEDDEEEEAGGKAKVKKEKVDDDVDMNEDEEEKVKDQEEFKLNSGDEGEEEQDDDDDAEEDGAGKKRKKKANGPSKPSKKAKTKKSDNEEQGVFIELNQHVSLTFSLKYLVNFTKSSSLTSRVTLMLSNDVPLLVAYDFKHGHIRYFLAPKIGDE
ncbi:hypothetical protein AGABI2DRAFT_196191 [Agaricus bisporus var. bisporus H97]|uniref:hypothetical protein n=1 Tax=Agaricus bisporus var. bisporus (strain H97 / ATCC MYA-4626 / FGSC 10389) TaxID=936046 RepID=UPI00029F7E0B|nr:hypothetical protein AGABI2DRAFT_196191 [Agaricus bisporus var. bisporus H97]EKV41925.1 hypothetical protein AGABI2DRAFT_196191 [Agaricus bisporus var. bisporus H97]